MIAAPAAEALPEVSEWRALAGRAAEDTIFLDPDFLLPAMAALGGSGVRLAEWRSADGRLAALAPFADARLGRLAPARSLWVHDYAPLGLPLVARDDTDGAVAGILDRILTEDGGIRKARSRSVIICHLFHSSSVAAAVSPYAAACGRPVAVVEAHERAMLSRPGDGPVDCRAALPVRRRKEFARQMRRLAEIGPVAVEAVAEPCRIPGLFEEFLALEAAGWKGRGGTAMAALPSVADMARRIVSGCAARRAVQIDAIRVGGRPVAMLTSFLAGDTAFTWKIAFDEAFARFSPGAQLMLEAGRSLTAHPHIRRVDSCAAANHPMIDHLWKERLALGTMVVGPVGGGPLYQAGLAAMRAEHRARVLARRLLRR
jgi:CelD/BcsL family acetyltransferase involved in cellulose biosynthesis